MSSLLTCGRPVCFFDAADILRNTEIRMPDEEAEKILNRLRKAGYLFHKATASPRQRRG